MEHHSSNAHAGGGAVERALDVIEAVARSGRAMSLGDVADRTGLPKSSTHRVLSALQDRGYVAREGELYSVGIRCFELGSLWAQNLDLRAIASPHLRALNDETRETIHLAIYDNSDVVYIEKLDCHHAVTAKSYVGRRCPAFCVSTGRALLAHQPWPEIDRVLNEPLPRYTENTVTDKTELRNILQKVREQGYAVNVANYREGVGGIAAPVHDHTGAVMAAVGCCLPISRMSAKVFPLLRDATLRAAEEVSRALGHLVSTSARPPSAAADTAEQPRSIRGRNS